MTGALDGGGQLSLVLCAGTGDPAGQNLRSFGNELAQTDGILVVDFVNAIGTEGADFLSSSVRSPELLERIRRTMRSKYRL